MISEVRKIKPKKIPYWARGAIIGLVFFNLILITLYYWVPEKSALKALPWEFITLLLKQTGCSDLFSCFLILGIFGGIAAGIVQIIFVLVGMLLGWLYAKIRRID